MSQFIQQAEELSTTWLSEVLPFGEVAAFEAENVGLNAADAIKIKLRFAENDGSKPEDFFLKIVRRYSESSFYRLIAPKTKDLPLVTCYHAAFKNEEGWGNLLFDDISMSHGNLAKGLPPSIPQLQQFMGLCAQLHRAWWQSKDLAKGELAQEVQDVPSFVFAQLEPKFASFVDTLGDALTSKRRQSYEKIIAAWPLPVWEQRLEQNEAVTLVHGDTHFGNFAMPKGDEPIYLQDWSLWHRNIPAYDLSYLFSRCLPEYRARVEQVAIQHYHSMLGIETYPWENCWNDYRLTMIFQTLWPVFFHQWTSAEFWYRYMDSSMTAFEDLSCAEFL
jgi:hypothetical protein